MIARMMAPMFALRVVLVTLSILFVTASGVRAATIQEVTSSGGIKAWLVEDHKLPLIAVNFAFRGGVEQDQADKQGLANLTVELLTQGAGPYDAAAFQQRLADRSITLGFEAGRDAVFGNLKTLSVDRTVAFDSLKLALTKPRFDAKAIAQLRAGQLAALRAQLGNPDWQARYALLQQIFPHHPYGQRRLGTAATLANITRDDLQHFAASHLARDNLVIAVAGDITPKDLAMTLDHVFGSLPKQSRQAGIPAVTWPSDAAVILTPREGTQTQLLFAMPGPKRDDPDWYAAEIANYILGGGGFASRLMQNVRDKKGLTYGVHTDLAAMEHGAMITGGMAVDNPKAAEAWATAMETFRDFYEDGASDKEIAAAKDYLTGALPLAMTSTDKIVGVLVGMQLDRLGRDYLDHHNDLIRKVTVEDVRRVIHRWFDPDGLTLSMVGKPASMTANQTRNLVRE